MVPVLSRRPSVSFSTSIASWFLRHPATMIGLAPARLLEVRQCRRGHELNLAGALVHCQSPVIALVTGILTELVWQRR